MPVDFHEVAYRKLDARLRAYGLNHLHKRHQISKSILFDAEKLSDARSLEAKANQVFNERQLKIIEAIREQSNLPRNSRGNSQAILILQQMDMSAVWFAAITSDEALRAEILNHPIAPTLITGPVLTRSTLGAPQINFDAIDDTTNSTLAVFGKWPKLRFAVFLMLLLGLTALIISIAR